MKIKASESQKLKYEALKWLRLEQRCMFIATEVGGYSADVLGVNEKKIIEVEVKVSIADLKADFKKRKHEFYTGYFSDGYQDQWIPNSFYYAVPDALVEKTKEYLADRATKHPSVDKYGVIQLSDFKVIKRAQWIHKREPSNRVKCTVALRMGSALIRFHEAWL